MTGVQTCALPICQNGRPLDFPDAGGEHQIPLGCGSASREARRCQLPSWLLPILSEGWICIVIKWAHTPLEAQPCISRCENVSLFSICTWPTHFNSCTPGCGSATPDVLNPFETLRFWPVFCHGKHVFHQHCPPVFGPLEESWVS